MTKGLLWFKDEFLKMLPAVIFFYIAFSLVDLIRIVTEKATTASL